MFTQIVAKAFWAFDKAAVPDKAIPVASPRPRFPSPCPLPQGEGTRYHVRLVFEDHWLRLRVVEARSDEEGQKQGREYFTPRSPGAFPCRGRRGGIFC